jgi:hypothetical protein
MTQNNAIIEYNVGRMLSFELIEELQR